MPSTIAASETTKRAVKTGPRAGARGSSLALATGAPGSFGDAEHVVVDARVARTAGYLSQRERRIPREALGSRGARGGPVAPPARSVAGRDAPGDRALRRPVRG